LVVVVPLQLPPQATSPPQSGRAGVAARWGVPVTGLHVPTEPLTSQASH
jgi:hypothetical protein